MIYYKRIRRFLVSMCMVFLIAGCHSVFNESNRDSIYEMGTEVPLIIDYTDDGKWLEATVVVHSSEIMKRKAAGLNDQTAALLPDAYALGPDGELPQGYGFIKVDISIQSPVDCEVTVNGFQLECGASSYQCFYNSSPVSYNDLRRAGTTEVKAGTEKELSIGFFVEEKDLDAAAFYLLPFAIDTGGEKEISVIRIPNQNKK